jgi:uncharacterized protein YjbJ (UPF0337 family)
MDYLNSVIQDNWEQIKENLQTQWDKLTTEDLEEINGEYQKLKHKLQELYHYKTKQIEREVLDFIYANNLNELGDKAANKFHDIKETMLSLLDEYSEKQKPIINYAKKNPLKFAGIAAAVGLAVGFICKK